MAGNFYTIEEVAELLSKNEKEVRDLVQEGKIREFRDGSKLLFKKEEIDNLKEESEPISLDINLEDTGEENAIGSNEKSNPAFGEESSFIGLVPLDDSTHKGEINLDSTKDIDSEMSSMIEISEADTNIGDGDGINILSDESGDFGLLGDSLADTQETTSSPEETASNEAVTEEEDLGRLDADINLDSFGSGSGLLDLSLQADDTSLGAVLDDILPSAGGDEAGAAAMDDFQMEDDSTVEMMDNVSEDETQSASQSPFADDFVDDEIKTPDQAPAYVVAAVEQDPTSSAFGSMLFVPMIASAILIFAVLAAVQNISSSFTSVLQSCIWYAMIGTTVVSLLILGIGIVISGNKKEK